MVDMTKRQAMGHVYQNNKTVGFFHALCKLIYIVCGSNFWFEDMRYSPIFTKLHKIISQVLGVFVFLFVISEWGSFYTQHNLTQKQSNDRLQFACSHILIYIVYVNAMYYKKDIKEIVLTLCVKLKEVCNEEKIERKMVKTTLFYLAVMFLLFCFIVFSYGFTSGVQCLTSNATFATVPVTWPDVEDRRLIAGISRVFCYFIWWIFAFRVVSTYFIMLSIVICLAHQYKHLCVYFEGLNSIFEEPGTQRDKEKRYEAAFKVGIKMHTLTLKCTEQTQLVGGVAFSAQVIINVGLLGLLFVQMLQEESLVAMLPLLFIAVTIMIGSGVFMWNAGDVTVEASRLPTAIFHSGWHNCQRGSSVRVRKLVTIAMAQAQQRVAIKALLIFELSYESYVTIAKSSYSLFSVIY